MMPPITAAAAASFRAVPGTATLALAEPAPPPRPARTSGCVPGPGAARGGAVIQIGRPRYRERGGAPGSRGRRHNEAEGPFGAGVGMPGAQHRPPDGRPGCGARCPHQRQGTRRPWWAIGGRPAGPTGPKGEATDHAISVIGGRAIKNAAIQGGARRSAARGRDRPTGRYSRAML